MAMFKIAQHRIGAGYNDSGFPSMFSRRFQSCLNAIILFATSLSGTPRSVPPKVILWSWFAEDDLRFLKDADIGVAYLALSLRFEGRDRVIPEPRLIPLWTAPNTWQMAVIRFDNRDDTSQKLAFSQQQRQLAVKMILEIATLTGAQALQIDFDALPIAYPFYRQLLADLRSGLGPNVFLSITALVSWCQTSQSWLTGLPVDEIVPMAFYMGQATPAITTMLQRGGRFAFAGCRDSIGVQLTDEAPVKPRKSQRAYFFGPQQWSPERVRKAQEMILP
jgi:hypothetical protein